MTLGGGRTIANLMVIMIMIIMVIIMMIIMVIIMMIIMVIKMMIMVIMIMMMMVDDHEDDSVRDALHNINEVL